MNILTQSPAPVAGTPEPAPRAYYSLGDIKPLAPLYIAPGVDHPLAPHPGNYYTPPEALSTLTNILLDNVTEASCTLERADNYLALGTDYFSADELASINSARNEAREILLSFEPMYLALTYGKPKLWYQEKRELMTAFLDVIKTRVLSPTNYAGLTVENLLDALIEA